eukprot:979541-Amphidinium_carterae.1
MKQDKTCTQQADLWAVVLHDLEPIKRTVRCFTSKSCILFFKVLTFSNTRRSSPLSLKGSAAALSEGGACKLPCWSHKDHNPELVRFDELHHMP